MRCQRRRRRLAVAAGNGDDLCMRRIFAHAPGKQFDFGDERQTASHGSGNCVRLCRHAGRNRQQINLRKRRFRKTAEKQFGVRNGCAQCICIRRRSTAIGHANARALARQPARHRQAAFSQPKRQDAFSLQCLVCGHCFRCLWEHFFGAHLNGSSAWTVRSAPG